MPVLTDQVANSLLRKLERERWAAFDKAIDWCLEQDTDGCAARFCRDLQRAHTIGQRLELMKRKLAEHAVTIDSED